MFKLLNFWQSLRSKRYGQVRLAAIFLALLCGVVPARAQNNFSSGSTGADGALAPTSNQTIQVPASGVFNYTTVNIPSGVTVTFTPNAKNTGVMILASGNVTIAGTINVDGQPGTTSGQGGSGGPGGFRGGAGGLNTDSFAGSNGDGRGGGMGGKNNAALDSAGGGGGGGYAVAGLDGSNGNYGYLVGQGGPRYGTTALLPLMGGSGGGGGAASASEKSGAGGGGGGAILIAGSGTITVSGLITARGGNGRNTSRSSGGGGGAGGAVRLVANALVGTGTIDVRGGDGGYPDYGGSSGGRGGYGFIRAETYNYSSFNPNLNQVPISVTQPNPITAPTNLQLQIASIGGTAAPAAALGSLQGPPDVVLPSSISNPVAVALKATNIPLGTIVQVTVTPQSGARTTVSSTGLAGTLASSTATASVTLPAGMSVVTATLSMDLTASAQPLFIDGEQIKRIEVAATYGDKSQTVYITAAGKRLTLED